VAPRDIHDRARLGIAAVVDDRARGDAQYERILALLAREHRCQLIDDEKEYW
jgi:uncharacterized protein YlxP (DUF503 family)